MAYAHSANASGQRHDLVEHLRGVAALARDFASAFGAGEAGRYLGLWHDVGKFDEAFQQYLLLCEANPGKRSIGPDHKAAGVDLALGHAAPLALLLQGHHGGLRTRDLLNSWRASPRVSEAAVRAATERARSLLPNLTPAGRVPIPEHVRSARDAELFLRLLFSALVDADYLDTERHFSEAKAALRGSNVSLAELWERLQQDQSRLEHPGLAINRVRREIFEHCVRAAAEPPGFFALSVPTGGGKTRSAMAFALQHAVRHGLERVIVAVPFISITEQTADTYRGIFGADDDAGRPIVLEHHSMAGSRLAPQDEGDDFRPGHVAARLASENWDAPIVVTTTVQLFESLFSNSTSACRKLHRLARSVIVLDEAQALPYRYLAPILDVLDQLTRNYGASVVLSTATQPAWDQHPEFKRAVTREIVPDPGRYFDQLRRVDYEFPRDKAAWSDVARLLSSETHSLAIINTKADALALLDALDAGGTDGVLHLSTLLCAAHRRAVVALVKRRLKAGEPCRLVSTQVIEAGVDLDFPIVLRAMAPLDSIIQAAGRCNREMKHSRGRVVVFEPEAGGLPSDAAYKLGTGSTRSAVTAAELEGLTLDPDDPATARRLYAALLAALGEHGTDSERIQEKREGLNYPETARAFQMIDDHSVPVVITRYGPEDERERVHGSLARLRAGAPDSRRILRDLQPYVVNVRRGQLPKLRGLVMDVLPDDALLEWTGDYDSVRGLTGAPLPVEAFVQ